MECSLSDCNLMTDTPKLTLEPLQRKYSQRLLSPCVHFVYNIVIQSQSGFRYIESVQPTIELPTVWTA